MWDIFPLGCFRLTLISSYPFFSLGIWTLFGSSKFWLHHQSSLLTGVKWLLWIGDLTNMAPKDWETKVFHPKKQERQRKATVPWNFHVQRWMHDHRDSLTQPRKGYYSVLLVLSQQLYRFLLSVDFKLCSKNQGPPPHGWWWGYRQELWVAR